MPCRCVIFKEKSILISQNVHSTPGQAFLLQREKSYKVLKWLNLPIILL
jgi:hypothetical protein